MGDRMTPVNLRVELGKLKRPPDDIHYFQNNDHYHKRTPNVPSIKSVELLWQGGSKSAMSMPLS